MKHLRIAGLLISISIGPVLGQAACISRSIGESYQDAEAVLEAKVTKTRPYSIKGWNVVQLKPMKTWKKGNTPNSVILDFAASPERPPLEAGQIYLMFLEKPLNGMLTLGKCSPQTHILPLSNAERFELLQHSPTLP
ncbi:MAG: hypothetical protein ABIQ44_12665 [Chloroflexia bacterium]